jgi:hypothetical protein
MTAKVCKVCGTYVAWADQRERYANICRKLTVPMLLHSSCAKALQEVSCLCNTLSSDWFPWQRPFTLGCRQIGKTRLYALTCTIQHMYEQKPSLFVTVARFFRMLALPFNAKSRAKQSRPCQYVKWNLSSRFCCDSTLEHTGYTSHTPWPLIDTLVFALGINLAQVSVYPLQPT